MDKVKSIWTNQYDKASHSWVPVECHVLKATPGLIHVMAGQVRILDRFRLERDGKTASVNDVFYTSLEAAQEFCRKWDAAKR